jgi:hypothetical protein
MASGPCWTCAVSARVPSRHWRSLEGSLFNLLASLDSKRTQQDFLATVGTA